MNSRDDDFDALMEQSSLGTGGAHQLSERTSVGQAGAARRIAELRHRLSRSAESNEEGLRAAREIRQLLDSVGHGPSREVLAPQGTFNQGAPVAAEPQPAVSPPTSPAIRPSGPRKPGAGGTSAEFGTGEHPHGADQLCAAGVRVYSQAVRRGHVARVVAEAVPCLLDLALLRPDPDDRNWLVPTSPQEVMAVALSTHLPDTGIQGISPGDRVLASLLAEGYQDEVIARWLGISVRTCRVRIVRLSEALGAASRSQLGVRIAQAGLVSPMGSAGPVSGAVSASEQASQEEVSGSVDRWRR